MMAGAASLMLSYGFPDSASAKNGRRIIVIGAGFAGLAAAYELSTAPCLFFCIVFTLFFVPRFTSVAKLENF
jgi:succinate dehydrogenase/fumarate reductase flavoprotein subunit